MINGSVVSGAQFPNQKGNNAPDLKTGLMFSYSAFSPDQSSGFCHPPSHLQHQGHHQLALVFVRVRGHFGAQFGQRSAGGIDQQQRGNDDGTEGGAGEHVQEGDGGGRDGPPATLAALLVPRRFL